VPRCRLCRTCYGPFFKPSMSDKPSLLFFLIIRFCQDFTDVSCPAISSFHTLPHFSLFLSLHGDRISPFIYPISVQSPPLRRPSAKKRLITFFFLLFFFGLREPISPLRLATSAVPLFLHYTPLGPGRPHPPNHSAHSR